MNTQIQKLTAGIALGAALFSASTATADTIRIAYPNWAEGIAMTHLVKAVLEEHMDCEVELTQADPGLIYAALADGSQDVFLDAWLPNTHADYWDEFGDDLVDLGPNFGFGVTGLVVPAYVEIDSIEELPEIQDAVDGKIIGIGTGAGIYRNTNLVIEEYGLDYVQVASSGPAMAAALADAIADGDPIIVTGWKPHWKFGRYDLKVLDDPRGVYPIDAMKTIAREGFDEDYPELAQFFINFNLTEGHLLDLMLAIDDDEDGDTAGVAREWMIRNEPLVESWFPLD